MIKKITRFLKLWNPFSEKYYLYYEPTRRDKDAKTIVKSHTKFEAAYNSPGTHYYIGKYLGIEDIPEKSELEGNTSLREILSRRFTPS